MLLKIIDCDHGVFEPEKAVAQAAGVTLEIGQCTTPEEVIKFAADADAILVQRVNIDREVLTAIPKVKVIGRYGSGVDNVDLKAAGELGVKVVYTPYFCFTEVANHTLGFILALTRRIPFVSQSWKANPADFNRAYDGRLVHLDGVRRPTEQTLGIVGLGKIGSEVAKRARVFGFRVKAYDPYVSSQWMNAHSVEKVSSFEDLLKSVDILTFHCPLTIDTRGMLNRKNIGLLKKGACVINAARGPIVEESALVGALELNQISGAALDVQEIEPLPHDSRLYTFPNVLITPHVAFYSQESFYDLKERITRYAINAFKGQGEYEVAN